MTKELPTGWEKLKVQDVSKIYLGLTHTPQYIDNGIPFLSVKNISAGKIDFKDTKFISKEEFNSLPDGAKPQKGDVLFARVGTLGCPSIVDTEQPFGTFVSLGFFRVNKNKILNTYIRYWMMSPSFWEQVNINVQGSTLKNLNTGWLKNFEINVPSLTEQKRIVEKLDKIFADIDKAKENTQKNLANAKEVFAVRLNCILENPKKTWEQRTFAEICDVRDGTHDSPKYLKEGYSLLTSKNLKNGELVFDKIKYISREDYEHINERSKVDIGDVLFAMIGTIGNPVVVTEEPNYAIKNMALFKHSKQLNPFFLKYLLESNLILNKMQKEANGTTQKFVSLGYLRKFPILLPPTEEQEQIVAELDSLRAKAQELKQIYTKKLADLDELKQSVLQQAFSGKL